MRRAQQVQPRAAMVKRRAWNPLHEFEPFLAGSAERLKARLTPVAAGGRLKLGCLAHRYVCSSDNSTRVVSPEPKALPAMVRKSPASRQVNTSTAGTVANAATATPWRSSASARLLPARVADAHMAVKPRAGRASCANVTILRSTSAHAIQTPTILTTLSTILIPIQTAS